MPELPEVETVLRGMEAAMKGQAITHIDVARRDLRKAIPDDFERRAVSGAAISDFTRRGKYIIIGLGANDAMILHLGMSGRVRIYNDILYKPEKHDHVVFTMSDGTRLVFQDPRRFGMLYLAGAQDWHNDAPFDAMGPEPLGNHFSGETLAARLRGKQTAIKTALLDQNIMAGLGNIYVCEALYMAGIDPRRPAATLNEHECDALAAAIRDVLTKAIAAGGSTLRDYQHTDGSLGYFQYSFAVYDREGMACPACDCDIVKTKGVERLVQAGRSTYLCSRKQI